jgi:hypothetical protein
MVTTMILHLVRGDGPIEPLVYLQTYALLMLPMMAVGVSFAILFDSISWLMGKRGDILYFFLWMGQISTMAIMETGGTSTSPAMVLDFGGIATTMFALNDHLHTTNLSLGLGDFDAAITPVMLPSYLWSAETVMMRFASLCVAMLPLGLAMLVFHRYSPDKVRAKHASKRRSPLAVINTMSRPLARLVQPLYRVAATLPGIAGQVVADVALTLTSSPAAILPLVGIAAASVVVPGEVLGPMVLAGVLCWGVLVCGISTRDHEADLEDMSGAVAGGTAARYVRQYAATMLLGFMFMGVAGLRWAVTEPVRAMALFAGVIALSALASLLGRLSRTLRTFLALFLFAVFAAVQIKVLAFMDMVGFLGVATAGTATAYFVTGVAALAGGYLYNRR